MRSTMMDVPLLISRILAHGATIHAGAEAVTSTGDGARRASYGEVGRRCSQLAHGLRSLGVTGDQRVATLMWNNQEHLEAYLAVPAMGAVLHPLNVRLSTDELAYVAGHAEDSVVIVDEALADVLTVLLPRLPGIRHVVVNGAVPEALRATGVDVHRYDELLGRRPERFAWPVLDERAAAAMCYTSGTTGAPKGVVYSHRSTYLHAMQLAATGEYIPVRQGDRILPVVPMFHANGWGLPYAAFLTGASLVLPDRFAGPEHVARLVNCERVTGAAAVPTVWRGLLAHLDASAGGVPTLRDAVVGGSACPPELITAFAERYGVRVLHAWGMTETSPYGAVAVPPPGVRGDAELRYRATQGRFPASIEARVVADDGTVQPWDGRSVGELQVRGPWVTGSYYRDDDGSRFDDGWLRTGDVGHLSADGYLTLTDRAKDVIKSGGEWISSVALENALMGHPGVAEASVVAVPDERWGERPLAVVVRRPGAAPEPAELRGFLAQRVPRWQVPERWAFVPEVPKTSVGKFDKVLLRRRYADGELPTTRA